MTSRRMCRRSPGCCHTASRGSWLRMNLAPAYSEKTKLSDAVIDRSRDMMLAPGVRRALLARTGQVRLEPPEPLLRGIEAPRLLVWDEKDALIPLGTAQDYLKPLRGSGLVRFTDLGHVPQEEAPVESLAPVADFLAKAD
jgi:pimeloyl-ACP methyl ester carboxylesterase